MGELELANSAPRAPRCPNWCSNGSIKNVLTSPIAIGRGRNAGSVKIGEKWKKPLSTDSYRRITWILWTGFVGQRFPAIGTNPGSPHRDIRDFFAVI
jgi:hypothetical protein